MVRIHPSLSMTETTTEDALYDVIVAANGLPLTHRDLVQRSEMNARTIRWATKRLIERGKIVQKFNFHDARQMLYVLKAGPGESPGEGEKAAP